jgi:hypothetical protein
MTHGVGAIVKVVVYLRKQRYAFNSSFNYLLLCSCSKKIVSSIIGACETSDST